MKKLKKHGQVKYNWRELAKNDQRPTEYKQKLTNRLRDGPDRGNKHKDAIDDITGNSAYGQNKSETAVDDTRTSGPNGRKK